MNLSDLWYIAAREPLGLWLTTPDPARLKAALYAARVRAGDPSLHTMAIRTDPRTPDSCLWIVNGESGPEGAS